MTISRGCARPRIKRETLLAAGLPLVAIAATGYRRGGQPELAQAEQERGEKKRKNKIKNAEDQQRRQQPLFLEQRQSDEHRCFKNAETARSMAEESQQRRGHEYNEQGDEVDRRVIRKQHVHRQRPQAEIQN